MSWNSPQGKSIKNQVPLHIKTCPCASGDPIPEEVMPFKIKFPYPEVGLSTIKRYESSFFSIEYYNMMFVIVKFIQLRD